MKKLQGSTAFYLLALQVTLVACSTVAPRETSTINAVNDRESSSENTASGKDTDSNKQRDIDDKKVFKEFPNLKFTSDSERAMHYFSLGRAFLS